jgi:hypothetical protein
MIPMRFRFTIRNLLWAVALLAIALAWRIDRWSLVAWNQHLESSVNSYTQELRENDHNMEHLGRMLHELRDQKQLSGVNANRPSS